MARPCRSVTVCLSFCSDQCETFPPSIWIKCQAVYDGSAYIFSFTHLIQHLRWLNLVQGHISSTVVTVGCMSQLVIVQSVCAGSILWMMGGGYFVFAKCAGPILWMMGWMFHVCSVCRTHFVNGGVDVSCLQCVQDPFGERRGSFDYQSILQRLEVLKETLSQQVSDSSDVEELSDSDTEVNGEKSWPWPSLILVCVRMTSKCDRVDASCVWGMGDVWYAWIK